MRYMRAHDGYSCVRLTVTVILTVTHMQIIFTPHAADVHHIYIYIYICIYIYIYIYIYTYIIYPPPSCACPRARRCCGSVFSSVGDDTPRVSRREPQRALGCRRGRLGARSCSVCPTALPHVAVNVADFCFAVHLFFGGFVLWCRLASLLLTKPLCY
jgi:hypothetical protein